MRIRIGHSTAYDFENQLYAPLRTLELPSGMVLSLPHDSGPEGDCTRTFFENGCDVFIAEVSYPSTGLGMEIAYASMYDVPVVCLHRSDCRPSSSLNRVTRKVIPYASKDELQHQLRALFASWSE